MCLQVQNTYLSSKNNDKSRVEFLVTLRYLCRLIQLGDRTGKAACIPKTWSQPIRQVLVSVQENFT